MARLNVKWLTIIGTSLVIPHEIGTKESFLIGFPVFCHHVTDLVNNNIKKKKQFIYIAPFLQASKDALYAIQNLKK